MYYNYFNIISRNSLFAKKDENLFLVIAGEGEKRKRGERGRTTDEAAQVISEPKAKNWNEKLNRLTAKRKKRKSKGKSTKRVQKRINKEYNKINP